jgi:hypothetical protein
MKKKYYAILHILEILYENNFFFILKNKVHPSKKLKKIYRWIRKTLQT